MRSPEERLMARAIELSKNGWPAPNPRVGCVIAQGGEIVGEGWCHFDGGPHAEVNALAAAGDRARGADAYVTLEPCSHFGRTPPCSQALAAAGVGRVFVACLDPNPTAAGGLEHLQSQGIQTIQGVLAEEAAWVNRQFLFSVATGRPYVGLKAAVTSDGFLARKDGSSKWITGEEARRQGHELRVERGAVLVGRGTVMADNPALTARLPDVVNQPLRVVLDPGAKLTGLYECLHGPGALHLTGESAGVAGALQAVAERGARGLLVEGGAITLGRFLESDTWEEVDLFVSPTVFGEGLPWANGHQNLLGQPGIEAEERSVAEDRRYTFTKKSQILGTILAQGHSN